MDVLGFGANRFGGLAGLEPPKTGFSNLEPPTKTIYKYKEFS